MSAKKLRWRQLYDSWNPDRASLLRTRYPEQRHDQNGWLEWYEVTFYAHGDGYDGAYNPDPDTWYAWYYNREVAPDGGKRDIEPRATLYSGPDKEAAFAACNAHYNKKYHPQPAKPVTVKVVMPPKPKPVAGRIRLNVRHEAGLEGIQALIAVEKSLHGRNVHIDAIYEGEDEWYAYGDISYPDPPVPLANRDLPPRIVTLAERRQGRRRSRR